MKHQQLQTSIFWTVTVMALLAMGPERFAQTNVRKVESGGQTPRFLSAIIKEKK